MKCRATAGSGLGSHFTNMNNRAIPSKVYTMGLTLYGYIIEANFGTKHSIKSVYYLEVQMVVVHKINYTSSYKNKQKELGTMF